MSFHSQSIFVEPCSLDGNFGNEIPDHLFTSAIYANETKPIAVFAGPQAKSKFSSNKVYVLKKKEI